MSTQLEQYCLRPRRSIHEWSLCHTNHTCGLPYYCLNCNIVPFYLSNIRYSIGVKPWIWCGGQVVDNVTVPHHWWIKSYYTAIKVWAPASSITKAGRCHYLFLRQKLFLDIISTTLMERRKITVNQYFTSPIKYLRLFHGTLGSPCSIDLLKYVFRICIHTRKSDSLKSYGTFQPTLPYLRRSCTTAWKKAKTNTSEVNAGWVHSVSASVGILW